MDVSFHFGIRPFVYKEIKEYSKELGIDVSVADYLIWGGFQGRFNNITLEGTKAYLSDLESTVVVNDLIKRYKIRKEVCFKKIVNYILCSNSRIFSSRSIHRFMKNDFPELSAMTVINFIEYLKEAYIIDEIPQYSTVFN